MIDIKQIRLLNNYEDVFPFLDTIKKVTKGKEDAIGFFPFGVYDNFCQKDSIWVLVDNNNTYIGHIMFAVSIRKGKITIEQTYIHEDYRRNNFGEYLVKQLIQFGEKNNIEEIRARVADDLIEANKFYDKMGLKAISQEAGGITKNRKINIRVKYLDSYPWLFDLSNNRNNNQIKYCTSSHSNNIFILDLNILNDLNYNREDYTKYINCIIKHSFCGDFSLRITPEMKNEINRNRKQEDDNLLKLIDNIPVLTKIENIEENSIYKELKNTIFSTLDSKTSSYKHKISDLKHLTYCIQNKCVGFITRDNDLIKKSSIIYDTYGVEINHLKEFVDIEDSDNYNELKIVDKNINYSFKEISELDDIDNILNSLNIDKNIIKLKTYTGLIIKENDEDIALIVFSKLYKNLSDLTSYIFCNTGHNKDIYNYIVEIILKKLTQYKYRSISIFLPHMVNQIDYILRYKGFKSSIENKLIKYYHFITELIISNTNWKRFSSIVKSNFNMQLSYPLQDYNKLQTNGLLLANHSYINFNTFETYLFPSLFVPLKRPIILIPIKEDYAQKLIGSSFSNQLDLFQLNNKPALLSSEKAYFKTKGKGAQVSQNDLIVFYVTDPVKSAIGVAKVTFSKNMNINDVSELLNDKGVIEDYKLKNIAKNDEIHTILFDNFIPFKSNVDNTYLNSMGIKNVITVRSISTDNFLDICKKGGIYEG